MKTSLIILSLTCLVSFASAQGTSAGASILKVPTNAANAAMGATAVTMPQSLSAASLNPASMIFADNRLSILFTHNSWIGGTTANHLSLSLPTPIGRMFFSTGMNEIRDIEVRTQPGPLSTTFSARTALIGAGWGTVVTDGILLGVSASYVYDRLYDVEATGLSGSIGVLAMDMIDGVRLGASVSELGSLSGYKQKTSDLPTRVTVGGSYGLTLGEFSVTPAVSYQSVRNGASGVHLGATVGYAFFTLKGSIRTGETARSGAFGVSVLYRGVSVDYALVPFSSGLGSGNLISIGIDL